MSALWLGLVVLAIGAISGGGGIAILIGIVLLIAVIPLLINEFRLYQERLNYCSRGTFAFNLFGIPFSSGSGLLIGEDPGQFFQSLEGLTCDAATALLTEAENALAAGRDALADAVGRRDRARRRLLARGAALVAAIIAVAVATVTAPWEIAAAIAVVAALTASLVAAGAELVASEGEIRLLEGVVAALLVTATDLRAQVNQLCEQRPATQEPPPDTTVPLPPTSAPSLGVAAVDADRPILEIR